MDWNRRRFLSAAGVGGIAGLAGCSALDGDDDSPAETPAGDDASTVETPTPVESSDYDLSVDHDLDAWDGYDPDWSHPTDPPDLDVTVETVVEGLEIPWDLAFAPDGDLFITERPGRISRYDSADLEALAEPDVIDHADVIDPDEEGEWWDGGSEGGLMGLAVHPNYPEVPLVYSIYTTEANDGYVNRLTYVDASAENPTKTETVLIEAVPGHEIIHNGARIAFGPANYLWVTTGDADDPEAAQDPASLAGKVLRLEPDGSAPDDNPDIDGGDPRVYSYGHRNPQGISFLPDGTPVVSEHGPAARDEVLVLRPGANYGWGMDVGEDGPRDGDTYPDTDAERPAVNTGPGETWAPPGCVFYRGDAVPSWSNRLVVGGLISQRVNLVTLYPSDADDPPSDADGTRYDDDWMDPDWDAVAHGTLADELGRIRHAEQGPDGALYLITSNRDGRAEGFPQAGDDRLVKVTPD